MAAGAAEGEGAGLPSVVFASSPGLAASVDESLAAPAVAGAGFAAAAADAAGASLAPAVATGTGLVGALAPTEAPAACLPLLPSPGMGAIALGAACAGSGPVTGGCALLAAFGAGAVASLAEATLAFENSPAVGCAGSESAPALGAGPGTVGVASAVAAVTASLGAGCGGGACAGGAAGAVAAVCGAGAVRVGTEAAVPEPLLGAAETLLVAALAATSACPTLLATVSRLLPPVLALAATPAGLGAVMGVEAPCTGAALAGVLAVEATAGAGVPAAGVAFAGVSALAAAPIALLAGAPAGTTSAAALAAGAPTAGVAFAGAVLALAAAPSALRAALDAGAAD